MTPSLIDFLGYVEKTDPDKIESFRSSTVKKILGATQFLTSVDNRVEVSHRLIDIEVEKTKILGKHKTSCRKGCASCCFNKVAVSVDEYKVLKAFKPGNHPSDKACRFLDSDNSCSVYEHRPSTCRTHMVVSDPKNCGTGKAVSKLFSYDAHIYSSAASAVDNKILYIEDLCNE